MSKYRRASSTGFLIDMEVAAWIVALSFAAAFALLMTISWLEEATKIAAFNSCATTVIPKNQDRLALQLSI